MAELNKDTLKTMGGFVGRPVEQEIKWKQGSDELTATVYVRKLNYKTAISDLKAFGTDGDVLAGRIASCICDQSGEPVFTIEDITGEADPDRGPLNSNLTMALLQAIAEVNGFSGKRRS